MGERNSIFGVCGFLVGLLIGCGMTGLIMKQSADFAEYTLNYQKIVGVDLGDVDGDDVNDVIIGRSSSREVYFGTSKGYLTATQIRDMEVEMARGKAEDSYYDRFSKSYECCGEGE